MGKLHTLRRAIQRSPEKYIYEVPRIVLTEGEMPRYVGTKLICIGAQFCNGQWQPTHVNEKQQVLFPYRRFVRATLRAMGYEV